MRFQSTQPEWAATIVLCKFPDRIKNFNPRSPSGLRLKWHYTTQDIITFQSTQPEWAATFYCNGYVKALRFQSTQPEWAATLFRALICTMRRYFNPRSPSGLRPFLTAYVADVTLYISIHAARVGCDRALKMMLLPVYNFNPRSPSGLRPVHLIQQTWRADFNPRSPSGLRRSFCLSNGSHCPYFNPRSPSGLRLLRLLYFTTYKDFNPRSPSGLRPIFCRQSLRAWNFNPRSPSGLRLISRRLATLHELISIHAARVGCDDS